MHNDVECREWSYYLMAIYNAAAIVLAVHAPSGQVRCLEGSERFQFIDAHTSIAYTISGTYEEGERSIYDDAEAFFSGCASAWYRPERGRYTSEALAASGTRFPHEFRSRREIVGFPNGVPRLELVNGIVYQVSTSRDWYGNRSDKPRYGPRISAHSVQWSTTREMDRDCVSDADDLRLSQMSFVQSGLLPR